MQSFMKRALHRIKATLILNNSKIDWVYPTHTHTHTHTHKNLSNLVVGEPKANTTLVPSNKLYLSFIGVHDPNNHACTSTMRIEWIVMVAYVTLKV